MFSIQSKSICVFLGLFFLGTLSIPGCSHDDDAINEITQPNFNSRSIVDGLDLEILYPDRAAMLVIGEMDPCSLVLEGQVCDPQLGIDTVRINDVGVLFDPGQACSSIETVMPSVWGLNLIEGFVTASDNRQILRAQSYLRSPDWADNPNAPGVYYKVGQASLIHLRGDLLDDGDRQLPADDLATLVELALADVDIGSAVPTLLDDGVSNETYDCVFWTEHNQSGPYTTRTGPMTYDNVTVDNIQIKTDHIRVVISAHNVHLPLKIVYHIDLGCAGEESHSFYGDTDTDRMEIITELAFTTIPGGPLELAARSTDVVVHGFDYTLDGFDLGNLIENAIEGSIRDGIENNAGPAIQEEINQVIGSIFGMFNIPLEVAIPDPIGMTLVLETGWDSVGLYPAENAEEASMQITSFIKVAPQMPAPAHDGARGSILGGGVVPSFDQTPPSFAMALKEDFLNQMLWALWLGGGFDVDDLAAVTGISELTGLSIATMAHLPPVIMPGSDASEVCIGLGDYFGELVITDKVMMDALAGATDAQKSQACFGKDATVGAWFSVRQEGTLSTDPDTGKFDFTPSLSPEILVEVVGMEDPYCQAIIGNYLKDTIGGALPTILQLAIDSFPAPRFTIPGIPGDIEWGLAGFQFERMGRYHGIVGTLGDNTDQEVAAHE